MKSFTALVLIAASATIASAQVTYNSTTGVFTCAASNPDGAFCAGDSLTSNIIIRCTNGTGQPGNCNDNLAGEPPAGLSYAPCWETSNTTGDAACSKNCIVYEGNGTTFTLPDCTQISSTSSSASSTSTASSSTSSQSSTTTGQSTSTASTSPTTTGQSTSTASTSSESSTSGTGGATTTSPTVTETVTTVCTTGSTTYTSTYTTTFCPSGTISTSILPTSGSTAQSNGTTSTGGAGGGSTSSTSPTATPIGPTKSTSPTLTGAAVANSGSILATLGLIIAYFL